MPRNGTGSLFARSAGIAHAGIIARAITKS